MTSSSPLPDEDNRILRGKIEDLPLADILQILRVGGKSGALFLSRSDGPTAIVALRNGHIVQAIATDYYQTLGERLVENGLVPRDILQDALAYMSHFPGMRIGDALVDRSVVTRQQVEDEVQSQMSETIDHLMSWTDADFEFRIGLVSLGRGMPDFAVDLVLDRESAISKAAAHAVAATHADPAPRSGAAAAAAPDDAARPIQWFDEDRDAEVPDLDDPLQARVAKQYLSISEELYSAQERGEMGLLLLRYASELYSDGALLVCTAEGFRVLGQFGSAFIRGPDTPRQAAHPARFSAGECPLLDRIVETSRPYSGLVTLDEDGTPSPAAPQTPGAVPALAIPLAVLGRVALILFCRSAIAGARDARGLIALARQVSITLENMSLREMARRKNWTGEPA
jgi:hypothetical protein